MTELDRRGHPRIKFEKPLRGAVGATRVYLEDASASGIRIIHKAPLPGPGEFCRVDVPTDSGPIRLDCEIVRTESAHALFYSGLSIIAPADRQSGERMRTLFQTKH
jgi:hypothetical protein